MQKTTKGSEVSYIAHYNKGMNDWSSYQPVNTARGDDAGLTGLGGSLVKKKKGPPKETARAYSVLPPPNRTGGNDRRKTTSSKRGAGGGGGGGGDSGGAAATGDGDGGDGEVDGGGDGSGTGGEGAETAAAAGGDGGDGTGTGGEAAAAAEDDSSIPVINPSSSAGFASADMDRPQAAPMPAMKYTASAAADDANHQAVAFRLRRELDHLHNRAELEITGRDHEIARLKGQVSMLKEKVTSQSVELKDCLRALDEVRRENAAEVQLCRREGALAERRASSMQARLGAAAANSERVFASANAHLETPPCPEAVKWERNVLADALAEIASAVVGGESATREEMAMDVEAAVAEGSDPLPKRTDSWAQFHYGYAGGDMGGGGGGKGRSGVQDGERAIRSLVSSVSRLHRRCRDGMEAEKRQSGLVRELEEALNGMTAEYNAVEDATMTLFDHAITMQQLCGIVGLAPSKVEKGVIGRLKQVAHILDHVHGAFEEHKAERARMHSQIIELDFYSKLHLKLLEQAKTKLGGAEGATALIGGAVAEADEAPAGAAAAQEEEA